MAGQEKTLKVFGFKQDKAGVFEINDELKDMQRFVNGYIEFYNLTSELLLVCNDEGLLNNSNPRVAVYDGDLTSEDAESEPKLIQLIHDDCFICRSEGDELTSIETDDIDWINRHLIHLYEGMDRRLCLKVIIDVRDLLYKN